MTRQQITPQQFTKTAFLNATFAAVTGTGVQWQNTGKEKLAVINGSTASTATIDLPPGYAGQTVTPFTAVLPVSNTVPQFLGPFDRAFNQSDGNVYIDLSSVTGVTVALLQDPRSAVLMTAAINPLNVVRGPANIWVATFGATEPAQTNAATIADPSAPWTFLGATQGGCSWDDDQTITDSHADQVVDPIGGRLTGRKVTVTFNVEEAILANIAILLNRFGTVTVNTGLTVYDPGQANAGSIPTYTAILVDGQAPQLPGGGQAKRRAIFRKVLNTTGKVTIDNDPTKDAMPGAAFQCYMVSNSISPYVAMDQTA